MAFTYNSLDIRPTTFNEVVPEGIYTVEILKAEERLSKNNDPMVVLTVTIQDPVQYAGATLTHYVTFLPSGHKAAGIALHFLRVIDEPHESIETLAIDPEKWLLKRFKCQVIQDTYTTRDGNPRVTNKIKTVMVADSEIPF